MTTIKAIPHTLLTLLSTLLLLTLLCSALPAEAADAKISQRKATQIALADAGFKQSEITKLKIKRDKKEWEIRFVKGDFRYEYEINAHTGVVKDKDIDRISLSKRDAATDIGAERAKTIALKAAGVKQANVSRVRCKRKRSKGFKYYDVSFYADGLEYEYDIDAYTGLVLEAEVERPD